MMVLGETEMCFVVAVEEHYIGLLEPGTAWKATLKDFMYIHQITE
jgi:hypothetical protein